MDEAKKEKTCHGFVDSVRQEEKYDYEHMSSEMQIDSEWTTSSDEDEEHSSLMSFCEVLLLINIGK